MYKIVINTCYGCFGLSKEAIDWMKEHYPEFFNTPMKRHDSRLVECVETLGDKVNTKFSKLQVKEIEGQMYLIDDYDGKEQIIVPNNLKWIIINPDE